jgi:TRAP-type transport system periplasmic protein
LTDYLVEKVWDYYAKPLAEDNLVLLGLTFHPVGRAFVVNKPLNQDPKTILKGMKIRVSGPMIAWVAETLGATPVMMDYAEVYEAGNRGIVNGMDPGVGKPFFAMKFQEIFKNVLLTDRKALSQLQFGSVTWMIVANKDKFAALPAEWQKSMRDTFKKAGQRHIRIYLESQKEAIKAAGEKYGMTYLNVPPETLTYIKGKAPEYWETWRKKAGPYGNKLLDDGLKIIGTYKK